MCGPLGLKGLDIRSRPLTFQLRVVALLLVDPIKKTERRDEVFARLLVGREFSFHQSSVTVHQIQKAPALKAGASYTKGEMLSLTHV